MSLEFPNIRKPSITAVSRVADNSLKSEMINGMSVSRPRYSRQLKSYEISWNALELVHLMNLKAFYERTFGGSLSFTWVDPLGQSKRVRFSGDLSYVQVGGKAPHELYSVKIKLEEV